MWILSGFFTPLDSKLNIFGWESQLGKHWFFKLFSRPNILKLDWSAKQVFIVLTTFYLYSLNFNTNIWTYCPLYIQNRLVTFDSMHLTGIVFMSCHCRPPCQIHKTDLNLPEHITYSRRSKNKHAERETRMGRKGVIVSRICRYPAAICLDFLILSILCCSKGFTNQKCQHLTSREWTTNHQLSFCCI